MELIIALVLFVAIVAAWLVLPSAPKVAVAHESAVVPAPRTV